MGKLPKHDEDDGVAELLWPPNKADIQHLYLDQRRSTYDIARLYKVGSSTIFRYLKKQGIPRRSVVEATSKTDDGLIDEWVRRYEEGETACQIAGDQFSRNVVLYHLHKRGIDVRNTAHYQKAARQKRDKKIFGEDEDEIGRLYLDEGLTCTQIANRYGLCKDDNTGGATKVWRRLRELGIELRPSGAQWKYNDLAPEWVRRYQAGESAVKIANGLTCHHTVVKYLARAGVELRSPVKYPKTPFNGTEQDSAYLLGFTRGDCRVSRCGHQIAVMTGSTHQPMLDLCTSLFAPYGPVNTYPTVTKVAGYAWGFGTLLDRSFEFLVVNRLANPNDILGKGSLWNYLAGVSDAEDNLHARRQDKFCVVWTFTNSDRNLLDWVIGFLRDQGFHPVEDRPDPAGVVDVSLCRQEEVKRLLRILPIRHPEKKAKARIVLNQSMAPLEKRARWYGLLKEIKRDRNEFIRASEAELSAKGRGATNSVLGLMVSLRYLSHWQKFPLDESIWAETLNWLGEYLE